MSEFSQYLVFRSSFDAITMLKKVGATGIVIPLDDAWTAVASPDHDGILEAGVPFALDYEYSEENGFKLKLWNAGIVFAKLTASSDGERKAKFDKDAWVACKYFTAKSAEKIEKLIATKQYTHAGVKDLAMRELGFHAVEFLTGEELEENIETLHERFPESEFVSNGEHQPWKNPLDFDMSEIEAILEAEAKQKRQARW